MKTIPLSRGLYCVVDAADFERLSQWKWHANHPGSNPSRFYALRNRPVRDGGKRGIVSMHRQILDAPAGIEVDHVNGDSLDNRRANLRLATSSQNHANQGKRSKNSSGYKGVSFVAQRNNWLAQISVDGKQMNLGRFPTRRDAARAYDRAALEHFGEFARLNFPQEAK
jgi:hypothetical protein